VRTGRARARAGYEGNQGRGKGDQGYEGRRQGDGGGVIRNSHVPRPVTAPVSSV
jgi:hypothetical protein